MSGSAAACQERLPDDAAEITILESDQLSFAQDAFRILRSLPIVLVSLSLLLFAIALIISPGWRRKAVRAYGIGFIAAGALGLAAISVLGDTVVGSLARTEASEPAIEETWTVATTLLHEIAVSTIGYGVLMWLGALLAGPTRAATAIRRFLAPYLREPGFAYGGLLLLLAIGILWWAPTPGHAQPRHGHPAGHPDRHRLRGAAPPDGSRVPGRRPQGRRAARPRAARPRDASIRQWASAATARNGGSEAAPQDERFKQLEQLGRLHDAGTLDDEEFRAEKQRILSATAP